MEAGISQRVPANRVSYARPIKLSIALSMLGELVIFVVWGVILYPEGSVLNKLLWTVFFCGMGMGGTVGALIALFVVDRLDGLAAILATTLLSIGVLGGACNLLCLSLDEHFLYLGGAENRSLFVGNGIVMSALGGLLVGWLSFTERGRRHWWPR